jgi:hypothetical protein
LEPVDFVDEKDIAPFERRQETSEVTGLLDRRTAGVLDIHPHRVREDVRRPLLGNYRKPDHRINVRSWKV